MRWQPMTAAPKDGTRILAYVSSKTDEPNICEIWWEPDYLECDYGRSIGGWDDDWDLNHQPKAWMPRPSPPQFNTAQRED